MLIISTLNGLVALTLPPEDPDTVLCCCCCCCWGCVALTPKFGLVCCCWNSLNNSCCWWNCCCFCSSPLPGLKFVGNPGTPQGENESGYPLLPPTNGPMGSVVVVVVAGCCCCWWNCRSSPPTGDGDSGELALDQERLLHCDMGDSSLVVTEDKFKIVEGDFILRADLSLWEHCSLFSTTSISTSTSCSSSSTSTGEGMFSLLIVENFALLEKSNGLSSSSEDDEDTGTRGVDDKWGGLDSRAAGFICIMWPRMLNRAGGSDEEDAIVEWTSNFTII